MHPRQAGLGEGGIMLWARVTADPLTFAEIIDLAILRGRIAEGTINAFRVQLVYEPAAAAILVQKLGTAVLEDVVRFDGYSG